MDVIKNFLQTEKQIKEMVEKDRDPDDIKKGPKTLCIDFDGVIHNYSKGFQDGTLYDGPSDGLKSALEKLVKKYRLICWTARLNDPHSKATKKDIINWLKKYDVYKYFDGISGTKIPALAYIDDHGIHHTSWKDTMKQLRKRGII